MQVQNLSKKGEVCFCSEQECNYSPENFDEPLSKILINNVQPLFPWFVFQQHGKNNWPWFFAGEDPKNA